MALIPDRRHNGHNYSEAGKTSPAPPTPSPPGSPPTDSSERTYRELLAEAGLDLSGHPLADRFDGIADNLADEEAGENETRDEHVEPPDGGGRWTSRTTMPETAEEVQACIKEIEERQSAWMKSKREEREAQRAAEPEEFLRNNPQAREEDEALERERVEWNARVEEYEARKKAKEEAERIAETERAERHTALAESVDSESDAHPLLDEYR